MTEPSETLDGQRHFDASIAVELLNRIAPLDPVIAAVLRGLNLRIYPGHPNHGDRSNYVVLDLHGISIGVQRRAETLYLHVDTSETSDESIAFEVNGCGENDYPLI
jgi:hypothetical protein